MKRFTISNRSRGTALFQRVLLGLLLSSGLALSAFAVPGGSADKIVSSHTPMREDYLAGSGIMSAFIHFCDEIRRDQTPDRVLPPLFEKYFFDSIEDMKKRGLSDEYAAILINDAKELIAQKKLTLYQWNVLFYRAVVFGDLSELDPITGQEKPASSFPYRISNHYANRTTFNRTNIPLFKSQKSTIEMLEKLAVKENMYNDSIERSRASDSLRPLADGVSCPVSVAEENLGIIPLAIATAALVFPHGITHALFFDGHYVSGWEELWRHDGDHFHALISQLRAWSGKREYPDRNRIGLDGKPVYSPLLFALPILTSEEIEKLKGLGAQNRKQSIGFLKWISTHLSVSDQESVFMAYFVAQHEDGLSPDHYCSKNFSSPSEYSIGELADEIPLERFLKISDLNGLLPQHLQGDRRILDSFAKSNSNEAHIRKELVPVKIAGVTYRFQAFGKEDIVEKWTEISSYVLSSYQLMCESWKKYDRVTQDLREAAKEADYLPTAVREALDPVANRSCSQDEGPREMDGVQRSVGSSVDLRRTLQPLEILKAL